MDSGRARPEHDNLLPFDDFSVSRDLGQRTLTEYRARFSEEAKQATSAAVSEYANNLIHAALSVQRQSGTDSVSQIHVTAAYLHLHLHENEDTRERKRFWGIVGGLALGAGLSGLTTILTMKTPSEWLIAVTTVLCAIGGFLVAQDVPKTLFTVRRRFGFLEGKPRVRPQP
jgi:hypothetical protein